MPDRRAGLPIAAGCALAGVAVHILTSGSYGYFRDEMYYLACGDHLAGLRRSCPLIAWSRASLAHSWATPYLPSVAARTGGRLHDSAGGTDYPRAGGAALRRSCLSLGADRPVYLATDTSSHERLRTAVLDGCAWVLLLAINRDRPQLLVWLGVLAGVGLENKHSMLFFGAALVAGLLVSGERRLLLNRWM